MSHLPIVYLVELAESGEQLARTLRQSGFDAKIWPVSEIKAGLDQAIPDAIVAPHVHSEVIAEALRNIDSAAEVTFFATAPESAGTHVKGSLPREVTAVVRDDIDAGILSLRLKAATQGAPARRPHAATLMGFVAPSSSAPPPISGGDMDPSVPEAAKVPSGFSARPSNPPPPPLSRPPIPSSPGIVPPGASASTRATSSGTPPPPLGSVPPPLGSAPPPLGSAPPPLGSAPPPLKSNPPAALESAPPSSAPLGSASPSSAPPPLGSAPPPLGSAPPPLKSGPPAPLESTPLSSAPSAGYAGHELPSSPSARSLRPEGLDFGKSSKLSSGAVKYAAVAVAVLALGAGATFLLGGAKKAEPTAAVETVTQAATPAPPPVPTANQASPDLQGKEPKTAEPTEPKADELFAVPDPKKLDDCDKVLEKPEGYYKQKPAWRGTLAWKNARKFLMQGKNDLAFAQMCESALISPKGQAIDGLVNYFLRHRAVEQAHAWAERGVEVDPKSRTSKEALGDVLSQMGKVEEARTLFMETAKLEPDQKDRISAVVRNWIKLAKKSRLAGDSALAERLLRRAAAFDENNAELATEMALTLAKNEQFVLAKRWAKKALELDSQAKEAQEVLDLAN